MFPIPTVLSRDCLITRDKSRVLRKRLPFSNLYHDIIIRLAIAMTFGSLNEFIGSVKIDIDQPHIALTSRNVLAHFLAIKEEDQLASGSTKAVGNDNAINLTTRAVWEVFTRNNVATASEIAIKRALTKLIANTKRASGKHSTRNKLEMQLVEDLFMVTSPCFGKKQKFAQPPNPTTVSRAPEPPSSPVTPTSTRSFRPVRAYVSDVADKVDDRDNEPACDADYVYLSDSSDNDSDSDNKSYTPTTKRRLFRISKHNYKYYAKVAEVALRFENSPENAAQFCTELRRTDAEANGDPYYEVITSDKMRRAMEFASTGAVKSLEGKQVYGIFADCKEDRRTAVLNKEDNRGRLEHTPETHVTVVVYAGDDKGNVERLYCGWAVPRPAKRAPLKKKISKNKKGKTTKAQKRLDQEESITGRRIAIELANYLESLGLDLTNVRVVGGDGTSVNTGIHKGFMTELQTAVGKKQLQWSVCLLHQFELNLRAVFELLDKPADGPDSYPGTLGKRICNDAQHQLHGIPVRRDFEPIAVDFPLMPDVDCNSPGQ
eukprot:sb/3463655/